MIRVSFFLTNIFANDRKKFMLPAFIFLCFCLLLGYLRVTDMGIARAWRSDNSSDTSGTPGYMGKFFKKSKVI